MAIIQGIEDVAAVILTLELMVILLVPAALIGFFALKGMRWVLGSGSEGGKYAWAIATLHIIVSTVDKGVHRAEDIAVTPVVLTASLAAGADTTVRSLRRRLRQPLSGPRQSA
jgi:hypothetical protein